MGDTLVQESNESSLYNNRVVNLPTPIQGKADWRTYRAFELENGVTCLVIHDKESKTTGMSCFVNVGASADPRQLSGLAHFCEHMCFLGSEKYPGENEYKQYLSAHGGRSNASTSMHSTNYKFEVLADHAEHAVDIFSNFFIAPLFSKSGTSREIQAVDSENSKNLTSDARRRLQILKDLADPNHYYSKFSTGNCTTLRTSDPAQLEWVRTALLEFHKYHYRPDNMTVVIAGPQSLDTLQEWIVSRYSKIPSSRPDGDQSTNKASDLVTTDIRQLIKEAATEAPPNLCDQPPPPYNPAFTPELQGGEWPVLLSVKPLSSMRKLVLMWPIPSSDRRTPDQSPSSILSHLLGHEGKGSAFAALQDQELISRLSAGLRTKAPDFSLFQVDISLTEKGESQWKQVVKVIFDYCHLLVEEAEKEMKGAQESELPRIWDEMGRLDRLFFHQTSPGGVYSYVPNLAERVLSHGTSKALSAGSMLDESKDTFPKTEFLEIARLLHPKNCIVERCSEEAWHEATTQTVSEESHNGFGKRTEQWYGVDYHLSKISVEFIDAWKKGSSISDSESNLLGLPRPNRYIPRSLELCADLPNEARAGPRLDKPMDPPNLLLQNEHGRLFHRLDDRYALPQASLHFLIRNPLVQHSKAAKGTWEYDVTSSIVSSIIAGAFNECMAQDTYDADLAGLYWSLSMGGDGIKITCFGFSDRLADLVHKILREFFQGEFLKESYFESTKDRVIRGLETYFKSRRADAHALYYRDALLVSRDGGIDEALACARNTDLTSAKEFFDKLVACPSAYIDCLFIGNVSQTSTKDFFAKETSEISKFRNKKNGAEAPTEMKVFPSGLVQRQLKPGDNIELHFASKNAEEENGAVICTYQSPIPSFRSNTLSDLNSLQSSAAVRLICHILREPLFDELRTKQQLGYIVSAYYELGYSSRPNNHISTDGPQTTPVDFLTVAVLSRKLPPPEIVRRIDDFMSEFRATLAEMPESEIQSRATALSTKMLKPIPKLQTESSRQFSKIKLYAPEVFHTSPSDGEAPNGCENNLPWNSIVSLASQIRSLNRADLLETWDRTVQASARARVVSCVYGKTFPLKSSSEPLLQTSMSSLGLRTSSTVRVSNNFSDLVNLRKKLPRFDASRSSPSKRQFSSWIAASVPRASMPSSAWGALGVGCLIGASVIGMGVFLRTSRQSSQVKQ